MLSGSHKAAEFHGFQPMLGTVTVFAAKPGNRARRRSNALWSCRLQEAVSQRAPWFWSTKA
jgi:hypothetical protein